MEPQVLVTFIIQVKAFTKIIVHFITVYFLIKVKYSFDGA
jgi:hypothetical protein